MRAFDCHRIFGPQAFNGGQVFFEPFPAYFARRAERLEFNIAIPDAAAEDRLAVGHDVQRADLFSDIQRFVQRQQHDAGVQAQAWRFSGDPAQKWHLL